MDLVLRAAGGLAAVGAALVKMAGMADAQNRGALGGALAQYGVDVDAAYEAAMAASAGA